jgi:peroxiredoxin
MIKIGETLPDGVLSEFIAVETEGCSPGPNKFHVADLVKGKKIVIFGLPGAFTPTCSVKHVPGYRDHVAEFKAKGVDEIWCVSVNDAFVMGAWAKEQQTEGKVRMFGDGSALWTKALGLEMDASAFGMGIRMQRCSMLVDNGVIKTLNLEVTGKFEVSDAGTMLAQV